MTFYPLKDPRSVCEGCGAHYLRHWPHQRYHAAGCRYARLTDFDRQVLNDYLSLCKKYSLAHHKLLQYITNRKIQMDHFTTHRRFGRELKDRFILLIKKFNQDFRDGWYDLLPGVLTRKWHGASFVKRRMTQKRSECAMNLSHCKGALFIGDCPRNWRECPLSEHWREVLMQ